MNENINKRVKKLRYALSYSSYAKFGKDIKISPSVLGVIESNHGSVSKRVIIAILRKFKNVNANWLLTGKGNMFIREDEDQVDNEIFDYFDNQVEDSESTEIPTLEKLTKGKGNKLQLLKTILPHDPKEYFVMPISSDSLSPFIRNRELAIFRICKKWKEVNNKIVAVKYSGMKLIRRVHLEKNKVTLISLKPTQKILTCTRSEVKLLGSLYLTVKTW